MEDSLSLTLSPSLSLSPAILPSLTSKSFLPMILMQKLDIKTKSTYSGGGRRQGSLWVAECDAAGPEPSLPFSLHLAHLRPLMRQLWRNLEFQRAWWENQWSRAKESRIKRQQ